MSYQLVFSHWNGDAVYTASEKTALYNFSLSALKQASSNYFAMEPRRLKLSLMADDWLLEHFDSPLYEIDRYIWSYKVKLYCDGALLFTGLVDTSTYDYDKATKMINVTCYDFLKLMVIYEDMLHWFNQSEYNTYDIVTLFYSNIGQYIDCDFDFDFEYHSSPIFAQNDVVYSIPWKSIIKQVRSYYEEMSYNGIADVDRRVYFREYQGALYLVVFFGVCKPHSHYDKIGSKRYFAKVWRIFNKVCLCEDPYMSMDIAITANMLGGSDKYEAYEYDNELTSNFPFYDNVYSTDSIRSFYETSLGARWDVDYFPTEALYVTEYEPIEDCPESKDVWYTGRVNGPLQLSGRFYGDNEGKSLLSALKASMILNKTSVYCDNEGVIHGFAKDRENSIHYIDAKDVLSFKKSRQDQDVVEASDLDVLQGDVSALTTIVNKDYQNRTYYRYKADFTIDNRLKYPIKLFDVLVIDQEYYQVGELKANLIKDEYEIVGGLIYGRL